MPPLLDSNNGREPHKDLELVGTRGTWRQTRIMARFRGHAEKETILFHVWLNLTCYHPPGQRNVSPSAPRMGNCLKRSCPGGRGVGQIKNNFLWFCEVRVISRVFCTKVWNSRLSIHSRENAGICRRVVGEE